MVAMSFATQRRLTRKEGWGDGGKSRVDGRGRRTRMQITRDIIVPVSICPEDTAPTFPLLHEGINLPFDIFWVSRPQN